MPFLLLNPAHIQARMKTKILTILILGLLLFFLTGAATAFCEVIHVGISPETIPNANNNDVLASIKAWTQGAAKAYGIQATFDVSIIGSPAKLRNSLKKKRFEIVVTSIKDIVGLPLSLDTIFVPIPNGSFPIHYVLVVHGNSGITDLGGLKDKSLAIPHGDFMQLASTWFEAHLQNHAHTAVSSFLAKLIHPKDVFKTGMQVFFRQIDAAVIPRDDLDRMGKLNPQMKKDLLIIGESLPLIPMVIIIHPSWQTPSSKAMEKVFSEFHTTPLGKQVLSVFHSVRIEKQPITILEPTLSFLRRHRGLTQKNGGTIQKW